MRKIKIIKKGEKREKQVLWVKPERNEKQTIAATVENWISERMHNKAIEIETALRFRVGV